MSIAASASSGPAKTVTKSPFERFNDIVERNPLDFNSWVQLLTLVETEPSMSIETVESTYNRFLKEFPLCFGYWNKYAQYEYNLGSNANGDAVAVPIDRAKAMEKAKQVYERGVIAVRYSVDMWVKYADFMIQTANVPVEEARSVLDRALDAVGSDPTAGTLWEKYIQLETMNNDMARLNKIFKRIMHQPLNNLEEFWEKYNQFVLAQQLHTLATTEEVNAIAGEEDMDEGLLRVKLMNMVENTKNQTAEIIAKRQNYESGIDRTYFHVTPVGAAALKCWHAYLDYEEIAGDEKRCEHLYERCLVACANYDIMWVRYAQWKERVKGFDAANQIFQRAITVFLKYRSSIYLEYALFLEGNNKIELAREQYTKVADEIAPDLAETYVRCCSMERRLGDYEAVKQWYAKGIENITREILDAEAFGHLTIWYANFVARELRDLEGARKIYATATSQVSKSLILWVHYIHFELSAGLYNLQEDRSSVFQRVDQLYTAALRDSCELNVCQKNDLWYQYVEFLENYGASITQVREALGKEVTWKRKNGMPRMRSMRILRLESDASDESYVGTSVGGKRARVDTYQAAPMQSMTSVPAVATAAGAATSMPNGVAAAGSQYAQYYQQYQGYTGAAAGYNQASYGQYGAYYPQQ